MTDPRSAEESAAGSRDPAPPCSCARCRACAEESEAETPLIVEERLRVSLRSLACVGRMASLVLEPTGIPLFSDLQRFARFTRQFTRTLERHLVAIKAALPVNSMNLEAPDSKEKA